MAVRLSTLAMLLAGSAGASISTAAMATNRDGKMTGLANLTVYHVNPQSFGGIPFNMDTGDVTGDLYFILRSVVRPIECAQDPTAEDCTDVEVTSPTLVATQLQIEVNAHFGRYGMCNICEPNLVNSSMGRGCTKATFGKYLCVGMMLNRHLVGSETVASAHRGTCSKGSPEWECWRNHLVPKIGGTWWSFFNESYCDDGAPVGTKGCAWRVVELHKTVNNSCLQNHVYSAIEAYQPTAACYANCTAGAGPGRNVSDPCWVRCTYAAVLGPDGGTPSGTIGGMPITDIQAGWDKAFGSVTAGGCPDLTDATTPISPVRPYDAARDGPYRGWLV